MVYLLRCQIPTVERPAGVVSRPVLEDDDQRAEGRPPRARIQTLVTTPDGHVLELSGSAARDGLRLGPSVELRASAPSEIWDPCYDSFSSSIFANDRAAVIRITDDNAVANVAGRPDEAGEADGEGPAARFVDPLCFSADHQGHVYFVAGLRICQASLPGEWRAVPGEPSLAAAPNGPQLRVRTIHIEPVEIWALTYLPARPAAPAAGPGTGAAAGAGSSSGSGGAGGSRANSAGEAAGAAASSSPGGCLIYATRTALYRLQLPTPATAAAEAEAAAAAPGAVAAAAPGAAPGAAAGEPGAAAVAARAADNGPVPPGPPVVSLLAGSQDEEGVLDGPGRHARFRRIQGLAADVDGAIYVADYNTISVTTSVRRVAPDGTVTTLASGLEGACQRPALLPNGYLALCERDPPSLLVLDLGLKPPPLLPNPPAARAGPPRRTLHADMGALLDAQPDGTADLTLVVGDRRFPVHRAILSARCDYFRQRLAPEGFADGAAAELSLPDTDPAAFELLLRFIYTGAVDIPPALAPAVAELADRLLLPELCSDAQAVVLSGVSADTVVGLMLWAERLGGPFARLLTELREWAVLNYEGVRREAGSSLKRLAESPDLMMQLLDGMSTRAKRGRTG